MTSNLIVHGHLGYHWSDVLSVIQCKVVLPCGLTSHMSKWRVSYNTKVMPDFIKTVCYIYMPSIWQGLLGFQIQMKRKMKCDVICENPSHVAKGETAK